jgi:hypothetical protein
MNNTSIFTIESLNESLKEMLNESLNESLDEMLNESLNVEENVDENVDESLNENVDELLDENVDESLNEQCKLKNKNKEWESLSDAWAEKLLSNNFFIKNCSISIENALSNAGYKTSKNTLCKYISKYINSLSIIDFSQIIKEYRLKYKNAINIGNWDPYTIVNKKDFIKIIKGKDFFFQPDHTTLCLISKSLGIDLIVLYSNYSIFFTGTLPSNLGTLPSNLGTLPSNLGTLPSNLGTLPSNLGTLPSNLGTLPSKNTFVNTKIVMLYSVTSNEINLDEEITDNNYYFPLGLKNKNKIKTIFLYSNLHKYKEILNLLDTSKLLENHTMNATSVDSSLNDIINYIEDKMKTSLSNNDKKIVFKILVEKIN